RRDGGVPGQAPRRQARADRPGARLQGIDAQGRSGRRAGTGAGRLARAIRDDARMVHHLTGGNAMRTISGLTCLFTLLAGVLLASVPAGSQQVTGTPGSPSATTTINGEQIPAPPQKFGGKIERTTKGSRPYWPARIVPPKS